MKKVRFCGCAWNLGVKKNKNFTFGALKRLYDMIFGSVGRKNKEEKEDRCVCMCCVKERKE